MLEISKCLASSHHVGRGKIIQTKRNQIVPFTVEANIFTSGIQCQAIWSDSEPIFGECLCENSILDMIAFYEMKNNHVENWIGLRSSSSLVSFSKLYLLFPKDLANNLQTMQEVVFWLVSNV